MNSQPIFVSAGDPSGDIAAGRLMAALRDRAPEISCFGLGGPRLAALGQEQLAGGKELAVMGFWEVARRFSFFQQLMDRTAKEIAARRPKLIVLVDYPGFNLRLAARVKHFGIPIVYYIAPQVWAWGKGRIADIRKLVDRMLVILPFEQKFFSDHGIPAEFVGHYLLEDIEPALIGSSPKRNNAIALLPGSRHQEIDRMLVPMLGAARLFSDRHGAKAVVAGVSGAYDYETVLGRLGDRAISIQYDNSRQVIAESDLVVTASGTATLETGIIGRPMVIVYKTGWLTYQIARHVVKLDRIGLANLVLDENVVSELIQDQASPERICAELAVYRDHQEHYVEVRDKLLTLPQRLGGAGASARAAELIGQYL
jgi:lipid-A-disaccharide synthase